MKGLAQVGYNDRAAGHARGRPGVLASETDEITAERRRNRGTNHYQDKSSPTC
ncbi:MAG: hypothetical protein ABSD31_18180 [Candidatus Binataceae bacterium]|jgi:hypothetical protein